MENMNELPSFEITNNMSEAISITACEPQAKLTIEQLNTLYTNYGMEMNNPYVGYPVSGDILTKLGGK